MFTVILTKPTVHIHRDYESRDCDSRYTGDNVLTLKDFAGAQYDEDVWEQAVLREITASGTQHVEIEVDPYDSTDRRAQFNEQTDEGYRIVNLRACWSTTCSYASRRRDHSAEAAGY